MSYLPQVAWTTIVNDVVMLSANTYRVTVTPLNINEPGSSLSIEIGNYLKDYAGFTFTVTAINVGGDPARIIVSDDLPCGYGPQSGQYAYIYESVGDGDAPFLAPIRHDRLDDSSLDYSRAVELDVLWKNLLHLDQSPYQTIINGIPRLDSTRVIDQDHQLVDKEYVDNIRGRRIPVADTDYTITQTFNLTVAYTSITQKRTVTLPSATIEGQRIDVVDESGSVTPIKRIKVIVSGTDEIDGNGYYIQIQPYTFVSCTSNGLGKWTLNVIESNISAGVVITPSYTDNGDGSVTIGSDGLYNLFRVDNGDGYIKCFEISDPTITLVNGLTNYIVADYNNGTPIIRSVTDVTLINETTIIPLYSIYRGGTRLHLLPWRELGLAMLNKIHQSIVKTQRYRLQSGLAIGEVAVRGVTLTDGIVWVGANSFTLPSFLSTANSLFFLYRSGGVWQAPSIVTQYNNTQYDNGSLQSLNPNKYGVNFIYRGVEIEDECYMVLGGGNYTLLEAQGSLPPANLPAIITSHAMLVGRIIVEQGASTAYQIDSIFSAAFALSTTGSHNDLSGLQGGTAGQYYHLTSSEYTGTGTGTFVRQSNPTITNPTIAKIANLIANGFIKTSGSDGTLSIDENTYALSSGSGNYIQNQFISAQTADSWITGTAKSSSVITVASISQILSRTIGSDFALTQTAGDSAHRTTGFRNVITYSGIGNEGQIDGLASTILNTSAGTITNTIGMGSYISNSGGGTSTNIWGAISSITNNNAFNKLIGSMATVTNTSLNVANNDSYLFVGNYTNSGFQDAMSGFQVDVWNTGTIGYISGVQVGFNVGSGSTRVAGIDIGKAHPWTGTSTESYGVYIDASTNIGITESWAIYSLSTAKSLFTGALQVKSAGYGIGKTLISDVDGVLSYTNGTISGISLGNNLAALTIGDGLSGISYNGSTAISIAMGTPSGLTPTTTNTATGTTHTHAISGFVPLVVFEDSGATTGFTNGSSIEVTYDWASRTITLTGDLGYYWRGTKKTLTSPWTSSAHAATVGPWFLYSSDGTNFTWHLNAIWSFTDIMVSFVNYKATSVLTFGTKETHGLMDWNTHEVLHKQVGTFLVSGGKLTAGTYVENNPTDANVSPGFDAAVVEDEDVETQIAAWPEGLYTKMYIGPSSTSVYNVAAARPFIATTGTFIQVNNVTTGVMVAGVTNRYYNVYQVLVPTTTDTDSAKYRMIMLQPQATFTSLASAQSEDIRGLAWGELQGQSNEFVVYSRITYVTSAGDANIGKCRIATGGVTYVLGNKMSQVSVSGVGSSNHAGLSNLTWNASGHLGDFNSFAGFNGTTGSAVNIILATNSGLAITGTNLALGTPSAVSPSTTSSVTTTTHTHELTGVAALDPGTIVGQLPYWDGSKWTPSSATKLNWNDASMILALGALNVNAVSFQTRLLGGTTDSQLYGLALLRSASSKTTVINLTRPDVAGVGLEPDGTTPSPKGYQLLLGRSPFLTDIILGDGTYGTGVAGDSGTGLSNAYIRFPNYGQGTLITNALGVMISLAHGTSGKFLKSNGPTSNPSWETILAGGGDVTGPSSSTDNAIARFDLTTGKIIQDSGVTISDANHLSATSIDTTSITSPEFGIYGASQYSVLTSIATASRAVVFPDKAGTVAMTSDFGSIASKDFWSGTLTAYNAISPKDSNTIYFIEE